MNMNKEQKELLNNILDNKEFLVEILKAATENKPKEIPELNIGDTITIADIVWRKFKEDENGNSYMLADDSIGDYIFGETNDWRDSYIRKNLVKLADKIKKEIGDKLIPIEVNLFSHDGLDDYGTCEDLVSILTYDLYRNNRKNIKKIDENYWLCTPDSTLSGYGSDDIQCVGSDGRVVCGWRDYCRSARPFFILRNTKKMTKKMIDDKEFINDLNLILKDNFNYVPLIKTYSVVNKLIEKGWKFNKE